MSDFDVSTSLGRLHVHHVGVGPPVVLWHSMFVDSRSWSRIVGDLAARHSLYLVDAPSSGRSESMRAAADISACASAGKEIVDVVRKHSGEEAVRWVGNAWGGHVGLELAATHPDLVSSLVAISSPTRPITAAQRRQIALLLPIYRLIGARGPVRSAIETTLFTDATRRDDPEALAMLQDSLRSSGRAMIPAIRTAILNRTDLGWAVADIEVPVLFITTDDRGEWTPEEARQVAATMTNARETTVHAARVIPAWEQPADTVAAILSFWVDVAKLGASG